MTVANTGQVRTSGDHSAGLLMQSIGGGGGTGGSADSTGVFVSAAVGGQGGSAGNGGNIAAASSSGAISTQGASSAGVLLQSIGGGGGRAGSADGVGVGIGLDVTVVTGGNGGGAGSGGIVQFAQQKGGSITTAGPQSTGVLAQAIGGGGGDGGYARSRTVTIAPPTGDNPSGTVSIAVTHGGKGGSGGAGGVPDIANSGTISTEDSQSNGITAQSIGGGAGDWVRVQNLGGGGIATAGSGSVGILAQSIGGGGGNGGVVQQHDAGSFNAIVGSPTAFLGAAKSVAQYLAATPDSLTWDKKINASVAVTLGGSGGTGGNANTFIVRNDGAIATQGNHASGIVAQSIGGGGGNAGAIDSSAVSSLLASIDGLAQAIAKGAGSLFTLGLPALNPTVQIGGSGGASGAGGGTAQDPSIVTNSGRISTQGIASAGIVAQSIGGGGGNSTVAAQSVEDVIRKAAGAQAPEIIGWVTQIVNLFGTKGGSIVSDKLNVQIGGHDSSSGNGGVVEVDSSGGIVTQGAQSPGILAQSVGGGGGAMASSHTLIGPASAGSTIALGGRQDIGALGLYGGNITVANSGTIETHGVDSAGVLAQSIAGGGGVAMVDMLGTGTIASAQSAIHALTLGGNYSESGSPALAGLWAGAVNVSNSGRISTAGTL